MKIEALPLEIGSHRIYLDQVGSTQEFALDLLRDQLITHGVLITARKQTAGKGRLDKTWTSETGQNFTGSIILQPSALHAENIGLLSMITALSVRQTLSTHLGDEVKIKWPNDIVFRSGKLSGILIQNQWKGKSVSASIIGIGININQGSFPKTLSQAISMKMITGQAFEEKSIIEKLLIELNNWYELLLANRTTEIKSSYHAYLKGFESEIVFSVNESTKRGIINRVLSDGRIEIESKDGKRTAYDMDTINIKY